MSTGISLSEPAREITQTQFSGRDFDTIRSSIVNFIQQRFSTDEYDNFRTSELGVMFIEIVAKSIADEAWYQDRRIDENYLQTAIEKRNVARRARQIAYKMDGAAPASADLKFELGQTYSKTVLVERGTRLEASDGTIYTLQEGVKFSPGHTTPDRTRNAQKNDLAPAKQTEENNESFISSGEPSQSFELRDIPPDKAMVEDSATVTIDGIEWNSVELLEHRQDDIFEPNENFEPPVLFFGDGIAGNIPTENATIEVDYEITEGEGGGVAAEEITTIVDEVTVDGQSADISVTNPSIASGGSDPETVQEAKTSAPKVFQTADRGITEQDFDTLINNFSSNSGEVAAGKAVIVRDYDEDAVLRQQFADLTDSVEDDIDIKDVKVTGSTGNNGDYRVLKDDASYNSNKDETQVPVVEDIPDSTADGEIEVDSSTFSIKSVNQTSRRFTVSGDAIDELKSVVGTATENVIKDIENYWDDVVSGGCKANIVQAMIVAKNNQGVFVAPSTALAQDLDDYLSAATRKESTVNVKVFDASNRIIRVSSTIEIYVEEGFDSNTVSGNVKSEAEDFLKDREFGSSVRISDLYNRVEDVDGVDWSHVDFTEALTEDIDTGNTKDVIGSRKNQEGDVIINKEEVATLESITVNTI